MGKLINITPALFTETKANEYVKGLQDSEYDDWTYKLIPQGNYFHIAVHDETGEFVAYWTEGSVHFAATGL